MLPEPTYFTSGDGTRLAYRHWPPPGTPRAVLGVVHGWSDHAGRYGPLAEALTPHGVAVYALDLRGNGAAEGQRGHIETWADYRADVRAFLAELAERHPAIPRFLLGHSMGGLTVLDYALHFPDADLRGLLVSSPLLAPPNVPPIMTTIGRLLARVAPRLSLNPGADATTLSRDPAQVQAYLDDPLVHQRATARFATVLEATRQHLLANLDGIRHPLLLYYGSADGLVPPAVTRDAFTQIGTTDKTRHEVPGGYHELINDDGKEALFAVIQNWLLARA